MQKLIKSCCHSIVAQSCQIFYVSVLLARIMSLDFTNWLIIPTQPCAFILFMNILYLGTICDPVKSK
ncbi:hypothetical protein J3Q64DRAFT_1737080 [Phycomyces blakesleeanus]|uniref:Uncharacterized protein n=1 Tax=Phycomyces blakesleeanus TaxID=4837 RepID=A0ABR3B1K5_PHYBL